MPHVIAIGSLLILVALSLVVTRVATLILVATGMSRTVARFQARSALTGAGFTTSESEQIVGHPLRRRVVMMLMLIGNVGIVASAGTLILGFNHGGAGTNGITAGELVVGLFALVYLSRSRWVDRRLTRVILKGLRRYTTLLRRDVDSLVELADEYAVCEVFVREGDWLAGRSLADANLEAEGLRVLGLKVAGEDYRSLPPPEVVVPANGTLVLYGHLDTVGDLDHRRRGHEGDRRHAAATRARGSGEAGGDRSAENRA